MSYKQVMIKSSKPKEGEKKQQQHIKEYFSINEQERENEIYIRNIQAIVNEN